MVNRDAAALLLALAGLLVGACEDATEPVVQHQLQVVSGSNQIGGAGAALGSPVVVAILADGRPLAAAEVRWRVIEGGGELSESVTVSDSLGRASVRWTLGPGIGQQLLLATSGNASITVRATGRFEITAIAAGYRHTCALSSAGAAYCWGLNSQGQLGDGTETSSGTPVRVNTSSRFKLIATGWSHSCAVSVFNETYCWGDNLVGQLGTAKLGGRQDFPVLNAVRDPLVALSAGFVHTCGLTSAGDAVCWGANDGGQLSGSQATEGRVQGAGLRSISTGEFQTCGVRDNGTITCWGWNSLGELGIGAPRGLVVRTPAQVSGETRFTVVAAGVRHTCAISTDGRVFCWGRSTGLTPFDHESTPTLVTGAAAFTALGTGNSHTCGLSGGRAYCWGSLLGDGSTNSSRTPVAVSSPLTFSAISVGYEHTCALSAGEVWCWGSNSHGQLGQPGIAQSLVPARVPLPGPN